MEVAINDIQADGSIRFTMKDEIKNYSGGPMKSYQFMSSDFFKVEKITQVLLRQRAARPVHHGA